MQELTQEDWVEIYYALIDKQSRVDDGDYEDEDADDNPKPQAEWSKHLGEIIDKIGPDGENMTAKLSPLSQHYIMNGLRKS